MLITKHRENNSETFSLTLYAIANILLFVKRMKNIPPSIPLTIAHQDNTTRVPSLKHLLFKSNLGNKVWRRQVDNVTEGRHTIANGDRKPSGLVAHGLGCIRTPLSVIV